MAYDEGLAQRFRKALQGKLITTEKRMMGGICFFVSGNMLGGADKSKEGKLRFMFRVGKEREEKALARPGAIPVEFGKRHMGGMIFVDAEHCTANQLTGWITLAHEFVGELPAKS